MKKLVTICLAALMLLSALTACESTASKPDAGATGKVVVNIEGTVTAVDGSEITLDSGKVVVISTDTRFMGDTNGDFAVGNFVQGYTADDPDADVVTAVKIYCNSPVRSGGKLAVNFEGTVAAVEEDCITLEDGRAIGICADTIYSVAAGIVEAPVICVGDAIQGCAGDDAPATRIHICGK